MQTKDNDDGGGGRDLLVYLTAVEVDQYNHV